MATETKYATSHLTGSVSTPANANGTTDGTFTTDTGNTNWTSRWAMGDPSGSLTGTQTITITVRKDQSGGNDPSVTSIDLYENGSLVQNLSTGGSVTSATSQTFSGTFDGSAVSNANNVEISVATTGAGGPAASRRSVQLDSIKWDVSYSSVTTFVGTGLASTAAFGSGTLTGDVTYVGTGVASGAAFGAGTLIGDVSLVGTGVTSGVAYGTGTISEPSSDVTLVGTGLASTLAIGAGVLTGDVTYVGTGLASGAVLGAGVLVGDVIYVGAGLASGAALGAGLVAYDITHVGTGLSSGEAFGVGTLVGAGGVTGGFAGAQHFSGGLKW